MSRSSSGVTKAKIRKRKKDKQFSKFIRELRIIRDNVRIIEQGAESLSSFVNTTNLMKDEHEIMVIVERNREVAIEVQNRLRSVSVENQELLKVAKTTGKAAYSAQDRIKRTNKVLRNFVHAVSRAEKVHRQLKVHLEQTITAHQEQLSAIQVGDTYFLVQDEKIASFDFDDISALSGENLNLENNLHQLRSATEEVEEQMNLNHSTLVYVGAAKHYTYAYKENRDGSFAYSYSGYSTSDRWSDSTNSSWYTNSIKANEKSAAQKRRFQYQRNIAIIVSAIATLGAAGLLILYFIRR